MKPNYKTSEFWFTVVSFIFSGLFLLGVVNDFDQKEELISDVSHGVESVILLSGQFAVLYRYIRSRNEQKKSAADVALAKEIAKQIIEEKERNSNDSNHKQDINND